MTLSQAWLCSARARSPGSSCGGQIEGSSTQAGFQLKLLDIYSDHFCWIFRFSRCALQYLPVTGATGQLAQHFGNLWCAHLQTGLKLYLRSELSSVLNSQYSLWSPQIKYLYCHFMGALSRGYSFCTSAAASVMTQLSISDCDWLVYFNLARDLLTKMEVSCWSLHNLHFVSFDFEVLVSL